MANYFKIFQKLKVFSAVNVFVFYRILRAEQNSFHLSPNVLHIQTVKIPTYEVVSADGYLKKIYIIIQLLFVAEINHRLGWRNR
jgi:hypothetical protein